MTNQRGVSLVEVLVAATLLAVGIVGTLHALLMSARLRTDADRREALVGALLDRLAWFEAAACAGRDTAGVSQLAGGMAAHWRVQAESTVRILTLDGRLDGRGGAPARDAKTNITARRPCP